MGIYGVELSLAMFKHEKQKYSHYSQDLIGKSREMMEYHPVNQNR